MRAARRAAKRAERIIEVMRVLDYWRRDLTERGHSPTADNASALLDALNKSGMASLEDDARELLLGVVCEEDAR